MPTLQVTNGRVVCDGRMLDAHIVVEGDRIAAVVERRPGGVAIADPGVEVLDAGGRVVAPGFIDLQVNGAYGIDLARQPERTGELGRLLVGHGVTSWLPTLISTDASTRTAFLDAVAAATARPPDGRAHPLGAHLEGPVLAPALAGAHRVEHLTSAESLTAELDHLTGVALLTLAPELPGALDLVAAAAERGIVVSVGHTGAPAEIVHRAADAGATYATHLFNAMGGLHHRAPGAAGAVLVDERLTAGRILDRHHLHDDTVNLAWRVLGPRRTSLVSDATAALGLAPGAAALAGRPVRVEAEAVRTADGALAGTRFALDDALRNLLAVTGCALMDALPTVTTVPARLLGLTDRGVIAPGAVADLVVLGEGTEVVATVVAGRVATAAGPSAAP
jgi:N-acetylglucosamine-6-phosphate deacetylase